MPLQMLWPVTPAAEICPTVPPGLECASQPVTVPPGALMPATPLLCAVLLLTVPPPAKPMPAPTLLFAVQLVTVPKARLMPSPMFSTAVQLLTVPSNMKIPPLLLDKARTFSTCETNPSATPVPPIPRTVPFITATPVTPKTEMALIPTPDPVGLQGGPPEHGPKIEKPLRSMVTLATVTEIAVAFASGTVRLPVRR